MEKIYHSLESLSATLHLPKKYIRGLADAGKIPFLDVHGRRRFEQNAVESALDLLAGNDKPKQTRHVPLGTANG